MIFPACSVRRHNHLKALSAMGLAPENPIFPTVLLCPFCSQNTLYLFDDITTENVWLCCQSCNVHGDIITFGSHLWNISLPDTLAKFSQLEVVSPDAVPRFSAEYAKTVGKQRAAADFLKEAAGQLWSHGDDLISRRLLKLGVRNELAAQIDFVGVARQDAIVNVCAALGRTPPLQLRRHGAAIVLPFYDLPKRLTGLLFLHYDDDGAMQSSFATLANEKARRPEAGYFMLPQAFLAPIGPMKKTQLITADLFWALHAQCQQLRRGEPLLPIMAAYSGPEAESYGENLRVFPQAERIFVGSPVTPELISRACNAGGYVTAMQLGESVSGAGRPPTTLQHVAGARFHAKTWQTALSNALLHVNDIAARAFLSRMAVPVEKLALFFKKMPHNLSQETIESSLTSLRYTAGGKPTALARKTYAVIERDRSWWTRAGLLVCNAQPVIAKVFQNDAGKRMYAGQIFFKSETYDFLEQAATIENMGLLAYAASLLAPHGRLVTYSARWNYRSHLIAQQLHPPELVHVSTQRGWDENANVFRFGNYELESNGKIQITTAWPTDERCEHFPEITPIAPVSIYPLLTQAHENSFIWATFAAVAANLLAPVFHKPQFAVGVFNDDFDAAAQLCKTLGCTIEQSTDNSRRGAKNFLKTIAAQHTWPVNVFNVFDANYFCPAAPKFAHSPVIVKMSGAGLAAAGSYGWHGLHGNTTEPNRQDVLRYVLPAYIQSALSDRSHRFSAEKNWLPAVLRHVHQWLQNIYGQAFNLAHAQTKISAPDDAHTAVMREVVTAIQTEEIALLPQPRTSKQSKNYILRQKETWWLNRRAVDRYFLNQCRLAPNWFGIIDLLQQNDLYKGSRTIYDMPGLTVDAEWVDSLFPESERPVKETG